MMQYDEFFDNKALKHKFQNDIIYNNCFWSAYIEKFER